MDCLVPDIAHASSTADKSHALCDRSRMVSGASRKKKKKIRWYTLGQRDKERDNDARAEDPRDSV